MNAKTDPTPPLTRTAIPKNLENHWQVSNLGYEVFEGNKHDSKTVEDIVNAMEKKYGKANRVWVMDLAKKSVGSPTQ